MTLKEFILLFVPTKIEKYIRLNLKRHKLISKSSKDVCMINSILISEHAVIHETTEIDDGVYIGNYVCICKYSYIHKNSEVLSKSIRNICSIGTSVHIGMFEHPFNNISTSNRLYLKLLKDKEYYNEIPAPAIIGNDVRI